VSRPADMDFTTWTRMFVRGSLQTPTGEKYFSYLVCYMYGLLSPLIRSQNQGRAAAINAYRQNVLLKLFTDYQHFNF